MFEPDDVNAEPGHVLFNMWEPARMTAARYYNFHREEEL